ncbi:heterokaryon incompatibility protein-domain-containing protein [Xylogone sp. PMI_703]|nr:heterokaryon incompatibility protein-domain-containing protein [Xylogone sp. PMI_703]
MPGSSIYSSLDPTKSEIRVVHLEQGSWTDPISCHLETVSLDSNDPYDCLSYVWGGSTEWRTIKLNGQVVGVTDNLFVALRRMRLSDKSRVIWIDQLAINQDDLVERTQQVLLMGRVYSQSSSTFLWLGEEPTLVGEAQYHPEEWVPRTKTRPYAWGYRGPNEEIPSFGSPWNGNDTNRGAETDGQDCIYDVFQLLNSFLIPANHIHLQDTSSFQPKVDGSLPDDTLKALDFLMKRPWWSRVWTFQEAILPPRALITYGPVTFPIMDMVHSCRLARKYLGTCCAGTYTALPQVYRDIMERFLRIANTLYWPLDHRNRGWSMSLELALSLVRDRNATDSRDKLFGILGLKLGWESDGRSVEPVVPDYLMDTSDLYRQVTIKIIQIGYPSSSNMLSILGRCIHNDGSIPSLPSWAVNWTSPERFKYDAPSGLCSACGGKKTNFRVVDENVVSFDGVQFDTVQKVGDVFPISRTKEEFHNIFLSWQALARSATAYSPSEVKPLSPESMKIVGYYGELYQSQSWQDAFWRTVCLNRTMGEGTQADAGLSLSRAKNSDETTFRTWCMIYHPQLLDMFSGNEDVEKLRQGSEGGFDNDQSRDSATMEHRLLHSFDAWINSAVTMKRLFVTRKGYIGIGPWTTALDDKVAVFYGGGAPLLLRLDEEEITKRDSSITHQLFKLIGECYVDGIMDGQALEMGLDEERIYLI